MTDREIKALSIGTLKAILFRNHVNARLVVEKEELVSKVKNLVEDEKRERADAARRAEEEERETQERLRGLREQAAASRAQSSTPQVPQSTEANANPEGSSAENQDLDVPPPTPPKENPPPSPSSSAPVGQMSQKAQAMASHLERTGLCVICQDEEANIAIVDCGYVYTFLRITFIHSLTSFFLVTSQCVAVVRTSSCQVRENVLYVGQGSSPKQDY